MGGVCWNTYTLVPTLSMRRNGILQCMHIQVYIPFLLYFVCCGKKCSISILSAFLGLYKYFISHFVA